MTAMVVVVVCPILRVERLERLLSWKAARARER